MNDFFEHLSTDLQELGTKAKDFVAKLTGKGGTTTNANGSSVVTATVKTNYEINLVPEVKAQMIKAQKMRNLVLFLCIVVSSAAVGAVVLLFGVKSGQDIAIAGQSGKLETLSSKLNAYTELDNLVTIQGQLEGISELIDQKKVLSRVFGALGVILPQGADDVRLSQLNVNLESGLVRMEGQTDARVDPLIDYRVLESLKKSVALTKYDYGRYMDADGNTIPAYCIKESDAEGNTYRTNDNVYAWWDLTIDGCQASERGGTSVDGAQFVYSSTADVETGVVKENGEVTVCSETEDDCASVLEEMKHPATSGGNNDNDESEGENGNNGSSESENQRPEDEGNGTAGGEEESDDQNPGVVPVRVKIWRTPQFTTWYEAGRIALDGTISNIEHFDSVCIKYSGTVSNGSVRWSSSNDCMLAEEGLEVTDSSNGRDESDNLVLKFTGATTFKKDFFNFNNKHMIAIGPLGQNVTDSYVQIGNMFAREATECAEDDYECLSNSTNRGEN